MKLSDDRRISIIRRACYFYDYKFPKELWTGVLFFEGERITIEEFNEQAKLFR